MKQIKNIFFGAAALIFAAQLSGLAIAQAMYKYVDKDGKVTYSDQAPKPGEKAELMVKDLQTNVIAAPKNTVGGVKQTITDVNARGKQLEVNRDKLLKEIEDAKAQVAVAKKALEDGQTPLQEEKQIRVRQTGSNSIILKEAYRERIAGLEAGVKTAEENLEKVERKYNSKAP